MSDNWQWWIEFNDEDARGFSRYAVVMLQNECLCVKDCLPGENIADYVLIAPLRRIKAVKRIALPKEAK